MKSKVTKEAIQTLVNAGFSVRKIALSLRVCQQTVIRALRRFDLKTIVVKAHPDLDVTYFKVINTKEKAYWLGFLYADGCVKQSGNSVGLALELATKDEERIDNFCKAVKANIGKKSYCTRLGKYYAVSIRIYGEFVKYLMNQGCTPNKTFRIKFPTFNDISLDLAFLLGFYDGDGTAAGSIVCGNLQFLQDIAKRYGIEDKFSIRGHLGSLYLPAVLKRAMFNNYLESMARKRLTSIPRPYVRRLGVRPREEILKTDWPTDEELFKLVWEKPYTALCERLGVNSPNTIKKRCIKQNIPRPPQGYWKRRAAGYCHEDSLQKKPMSPPKNKRLTPDQIVEIRRLLAKEVGCREIGRLIGCCHTRVSDIKTGKTHKVVEPREIASQ